MSMPSLNALHEKLQRLEGRWVGKEHLHPSPWDDKGGPAESEVVNRVALDGFAVVQDYVQRRHGKVTYRGHGLFRVEPDGHTIAMDWYDSIGFPPETFHGEFDGETLALSSKGAQGTMRATWTFHDRNRYDHCMEVSGDGSGWKPFMDGEYRREGKGDGEGK